MPSKYSLIRTAIQERKTLSFRYIDPDGASGDRVNAQVVAYGISKANKRVIRAYVKPPSVSHSGLRAKGEWRMFLVSNISGVKLSGSKW